MGNFIDDVKVRLGLKEKEKPEFRTVYIGASRRLPNTKKNGKKGGGLVSNRPKDRRVELEHDDDLGQIDVEAQQNGSDDEDNVIFERKGSIQWAQERIAHHTEQEFPTNIIISSRYTMLNFIPKNMFEQFRRIANFYFLCMAVIQLTIESPVEPITSVLPLVFVIGITMLKQAYEDYLRHVADRQVNNRIVYRLSHKGSLEKVKSKDLKCGDIVYSLCESKFPCDLVLLASSEPDGKAQVQTANLDGETNLKVIKAPGLPEMHASNESRNENDENGNTTGGGKPDEMDSEQLSNVFKTFRATLECEQPTHDLYKFRGNLHCINPDSGDETAVVPVSEKNLLLGGARLKNTGFTLGACVYTGRDSKMALNSLYQSNKFSTLEKTMNRFLLVCLLVLACLVIALTSLRWHFIQTNPTGDCSVDKGWYFLDGAQSNYSLCNSNPQTGGHKDGRPKVLDSLLQKESPGTPTFSKPAQQIATGALGSLVPPGLSQSESGESLPMLILRVIENALAFVILFNVVIPISLYVTVEVQRFLGSRFVAWDLEMYDAQRDQPAKVNSSDLNEELGQIEYLFSDKTGTLTENDMRFRKCSIRGVRYQEKRSSGFLMLEPRTNKKGWQVMGEVEEDEDDETMTNNDDSQNNDDADTTDIGSDSTAAVVSENERNAGSYFNSAHEGTDDERDRVAARRAARAARKGDEGPPPTVPRMPPPSGSALARDPSTVTLPARMPNSDAEGSPPHTERPRSQSEGIVDVSQLRTNITSDSNNKTGARNSSNKSNLVDVYKIMRDDGDFEMFFLGLVLCHSLYVSRADAFKPDAGDEGDGAKKKKKTTAGDTIAHAVAQIAKPLKTGQEYLVGDKNPLKRLVLGNIAEDNEADGPNATDGDDAAPMDANDKRRVQHDVNEKFKQLEEMMRQREGKKPGETDAEDDDGLTKLAVFEESKDSASGAAGGAGGAAAAAGAGAGGAGGAHPILMKMKSYAGGATASDSNSAEDHSTADALVDHAVGAHSHASRQVNLGDVGGKGPIAAPNLSRQVNALGLETTTDKEPPPRGRPQGQEETGELYRPKTVDSPEHTGGFSAAHPQSKFSSIKSYIDKGVKNVPRGRAKHSRATSVTGRGAKSRFYAPQDVPGFDSLVYEGASPDEKSLVEACARMGIFFLGQIHEQPGVVAVKIRGETGLRRYKVLHTLEFDNVRRRMSVIVKRVYTLEDTIEPGSTDSGKAGMPARNAAADTTKSDDPHDVVRNEAMEMGGGGPETPKKQQLPAVAEQSDTDTEGPDNKKSSPKSSSKQYRGTMASAIKSGAGGNSSGEGAKRSNDVIMFCKGADSNMLPIGVDGEIKQTSKDVDDYSMQGLRCLVMGMKFMSEDDYVAMKAELAEAEQNLDVDARDKHMSEIYQKYESDLHILGTTAVEDRLQEHVHQTLRDLRSAGIKVFVLTGDKIDTAVQIAHSCGHFQRGMYELRCAGLTDKEEIRAKLTKIIEIVSNPEPPAQPQGDASQPSSTQNGGGENNAPLSPPSYEKVTSEQNNNSMPLAKLNGSAGANADAGADKPLFRGYWMLLDGVSLTTIFVEPELEKLLSRACAGCVAVLTCRCAPIQKAQIVRIMKNIPSHPTTAAVGDGANDVSMIQEAHVGLGIFGKEGRQAARSADFSMSRFHHLRRLLLVHGHWFYIRIAILVCYFFYKNFAMVMPQVFYTFDSAFSQQSLYDGFYLTFYNMLFTTLPILLYGLIEQHWNSVMLLQYPELYAINAKNVRLSWSEFFKWNLLGVWHAVVAYYGAKFIVWRIVGGSIMPYYGRGGDQTMWGAYVGFIIVIITNLRLALETRHWTWPTVGGFAITFVSYFVLNVLYTAITWVPLLSHDDYHYVWFSIVCSPMLMLGMLLLIVLAFIPDLICVVFERHYELLLAFQACERMGRTLTLIPISAVTGQGAEKQQKDRGKPDEAAAAAAHAKYGTFDGAPSAAIPMHADASASALHDGLAEQQNEPTRHQEVLMPSSETDDAVDVNAAPKDRVPGGGQAHSDRLFPGLNKARRDVRVVDGPFLRPEAAALDASPIRRTQQQPASSNVVWGTSASSRQKSRVPPPPLQRPLSRSERRAYKRAMTARGYDADQTPPGSPSDLRTAAVGGGGRFKWNYDDDDDEDDEVYDTAGTVQYRSAGSSPRRGQQQQQQQPQQLQQQGSRNVGFGGQVGSPAGADRWKFGS